MGIKKIIKKEVRRLKLKKIFAFLVSAMILSASLGSIVPSATEDTYFTADNGYIIEYTGSDTEIVLPKEVNGQLILGLSTAFMNKTTIKSVIVPDGYTVVLSDAFMGASSLKSVSLPETLETLGSSCFRTCTSLETINIPNKITSIPKYAFRECTNPDLVIDIQSTSLTSVSSSAFQNVVGTIKVYSQEMYDLISPVASSAKVILVEATDPTDPSFFTVDSISTSMITGYTGSDAGIVLPTEINGVTMTEIAGSAFRNNTTIASVVISEGYANLGGQAFRGCTSLKTVVLPDTLTGSMGNYVFRDCSALESINIPKNITSINMAAFRDCTSADLVIDIQSTSLTSVSNSAFQNVVGTIKVHSQAMYDLISANATTAKVVLESGNIPVNPLDYTNLNKALADGEAVDTSKYAEALITVLTDAIAAGKAVKENTSATQEDVDNAAKAINDAIANLKFDYTALDSAIASGEAVDTSAYTNASVTALTDAIAAGKAVKENTSATQTDIDNAAKAITDAIAGLVVKLDYTALDAAIKEAEDIIANHSDEYTEESVASLQRSLNTAKTYREMDENIMNQITIESEASILKVNIGKLVKLDIPAMLNDLKAVIAEAEAIDSSEYTEESYKVLADAIEAAKAMNEDTNYKDILAAQSSIQNAVSKLILKPLEEFAKVYKGGTVAEIASGKADASMAGATSVRVTFNCASDVSYNEYASIELQAIVSGTQSNEKFLGKGDYTEGTNGWTETLALTNAVEEGQSYEITAFTYSWADASDYVYAVSKVEFLDAEGKVLSKVTANTQALKALKEAIEEAEEVDISLYTEDSAVVLTTAIGVAKTITEKSTVAEIEAATETIVKAIEGLELKVKYGNISGKITVSDGDESTEMTVTAIAQDGTETGVTTTSMGSYSIENIEEGEYTITISGGKYAPRSYEVVVSEGSITQDADLNPYGDINGDGKVTTADVGMANSHAKGVTELTGYKYTCANVKTGDEITTADVGMINSHAKSVDTLW